MTFPQFILDKIKPFTDSFDKDLKYKLNAVNNELSAKGLINSSVQIKRHQDEFLILLGELISKISVIVSNDIKNKQLGKPEFIAVRNTIEELVTPLIKQFSVGFEAEIRGLLPKVESANSVIANFDSDLKNRLNQLFVDIEQNFDAI